jgi:hypothetical protein
MIPQHSDALVLFGATGDLAYKKVFPSLQAMLKRGHLNVPDGHDRDGSRGNGRDVGAPSPGDNRNGCLRKSIGGRDGG